MDQDEEEEWVCDELKKKWSRVYQFVGWAVKKKVNREALLHTLKSCKYKRVPSDQCWAYCAGTLKIVNGNFNEAEWVKDHKVDFSELVEKLRKL